MRVSGSDHASITDEHIFALRDIIAPYATPRPLSSHTKGEREIIAMCDSALNPYCHASRRMEARARCAEIINAREPKP